VKATAGTIALIKGVAPDVSKRYATYTTLYRSLILGDQAPIGDYTTGFYVEFDTPCFIVTVLDVYKMLPNIRYGKNMRWVYVLTSARGPGWIHELQLGTP
jgi:hypothetical protein